VTGRDPSTIADGEIGAVLLALDRVIAARRGESPDRSYTSRLLAGGVEKAGGKVAEEAEEFIRAAAGEADERVVSEAADLLYHMLVLLACRGLSLQPVELARRFGTSGLVEKASRAAAARVEGGDA
jgi:phosphoribosyl-ATP pyrophosphohydrolase/phosphoribosyl-AMP cyclohydrolase